MLAPRGRSRADLAERVAARMGATVRRFFHQQAEPSKAPGLPIFENLTLGFEVVDASGARIAAFVDDLTLQADLERSTPPRAGWYRIVADDPRLLRLVTRHCDAEAPLDNVLEPLAALFGTDLERHEAGMVRAADDRGAAIALGATLPGERERPCEIVTAPIARDHHATLSALLEDARAEAFTVPREGATHIHFDAAALQSPATLARLVDALTLHGEALKQICEANPHCVRLGHWPPALNELTRSEAFAAMDWPQARAALKKLGLSKFCDFNLVNLVNEDRAKHTFEVRILPATLDAASIMAAAALFEGLLRWCSTSAAPTADVRALLQALPLSADMQAHWSARLRAG